MGRTAKSSTNIDVRAIRKLAGLNQTDFWTKIGVTQSGGCRYESGRNIPAPVRILLELTYILPEKKAANRLEELRKAA